MQLDVAGAFINLQNSTRSPLVPTPPFGAFSFSQCQGVVLVQEDCVLPYGLDSCPQGPPLQELVHHLRQAD